MPCVDKHRTVLSDKKIDELLQSLRDKIAFEINDFYRYGTKVDICGDVIVNIIFTILVDIIHQFIDSVSKKSFDDVPAILEKFTLKLYQSFSAYVKIERLDSHPTVN